MKIRKRLISLLLATAMIFIAMFSGFFSIKSEAASTLRVSASQIRRLPAAKKGNNRVTFKKGAGYVKYKATRSGYIRFKCTDARVGTNPNTVGSVGLIFYRYKNNRLYPITFTNGKDQLWLVTNGYRRKYGGTRTWNVDIKMKKGETLVIYGTFLDKRMCNYNIKIS